MHLEILKISHGGERVAVGIVDGECVRVGGFAVFCSAGGKVRNNPTSALVT